MFTQLRFLLQQRKAARHDVVLVRLQGIKPDNILILEQYVRLSGLHLDLPDSTPLRIGAYSYIRSGSRVQYLSEIGRYCSIGRNVVLGETPRNHPVNWVSTHLAVSHRYQARHEHTCIGHDVWIGHDAVIMAGVNIGTGAIIARNAVVTKDVAPYQIVGGNPARPLRFRFAQPQREALLDSAWWNLDYQTLRQLPFDNPDRFLQLVTNVNKPAHFSRLRIEHGRLGTDSDTGEKVCT